MQAIRSNGFLGRSGRRGGAAGVLLAVSALAVALTCAGCGGEPALQVPSRAVYFWPSEQYESMRRDPQQRFFEMGAPPPTLFFRAGSECGSVRSLRISIDGWSPATAVSGVSMPAAPPTAQYFVSDRYATAAARFTPAQAIDWVARGGREVIEVRATEVGDSPTPVAAVEFHGDWLYRLTFLAEVADAGVGRYQRTIWLGPAGRREQALAWDAPHGE